MALEDLTGTKYIDDLNSSNPAAGDNVSEGDDHIRGIKNVLKTTFPSIDGAVTATDTELNYVDGVTSAVQTQLDAKLPLTGGAMTGAITTNSTFDGVDIATRDAVLTSTTTTANAALPKAGGTMTGNTIHNDNVKALFGTGSDLEIYHDGGDTYIKEVGTGALYIASNEIKITNAGATENVLVGVEDSTVRLYHNNVNKLETTATGIEVLGGSDIGSYTANTNADNLVIQETGDFSGITLLADNDQGSNIYFADPDDDNVGGITYNHASNDIRFRVNGGEEMRLESDGDLHVDGDVIAYSTTVSDEALKYDINPVEFALDKINQLKGVSYKYKHNDRESAGLLAQDVEKVMPSAVKSRKVPLVTGDDKEYKTLHYDSMTAILVEAIKELTAKVEKLENK